VSPLAARLVAALTAHPAVAFEVLRALDEKVVGPWEGDAADPDASLLRWRPGVGAAAVAVVLRDPGPTWSYVFNSPDGVVVETQEGFASRGAAIDAVDQELRAAGLILCEAGVQDPGGGQ